MTAYLVLGLAMVTTLETGKIHRAQILAGAAFYLVGAVVGLFRLLRTASSADVVTEEDYGLSTARLIQAPLFSGIAAVAGAALVRVLPNTLPTSTGGKIHITLNNVFSLQRWPEGLIFAAIFGLTPSLLFTTLQQRGDEFRKDLKSSEPGDKPVTTH